MRHEHDIPVADDVVGSGSHQKNTVLRFGGGLAAVLLAGTAYFVGGSSNEDTSTSSNGVEETASIDQLEQALVVFPSPASSPESKESPTKADNFLAAPNFCNAATLSEVAQVMGESARCYVEKPENNITASARFQSDYGASPVYFFIERSVNRRVHEDVDSKFYIGNVACYHAFAGSAIICHVVDRSGASYSVDIVHGNQYRDISDSGRLAAIALKAVNVVDY